MACSVRFKIQDYFIISSEKLSNSKVLLRFSSKHHSEQLPDFLECLSGEYCTTLSKSTETIWCTISFNVEQDEHNYVQHDYIMKIMKPCQAHIQP